MKNSFAKPLAACAMLCAGVLVACDSPGADGAGLEELSAYV